MIAVWEGGEGREGGVPNLRESHLLEDLRCELLETSDVDRALLGRVQVTASHTQVAGGTHHAAGESQWVVGEDSLRSSVVVLGSDAGDEGLDVDLGGTALLAGGVGALETPVGLTQGPALTQGGVFDVIEIVGQVLTGVACFVLVPLPVSAGLLSLQCGHQRGVRPHARVQSEEVLNVRRILCEVQVRTHTRMGNMQYCKTIICKRQE